MGLKTETREIGGRKFSVTQLGTEQGLPLFFKLGKLVGPSVAALVKQWRDGKITPDLAADALTEFVAALQWSDFKLFYDTFVESSHVIGKDPETGAETRTPVAKLREILFGGDYMTLVKWMGFCIEVNFASFFAGMGVTKLPGSPVSE